jgi:hypothetical protein
MATDMDKFRKLNGKEPNRYFYFFGQGQITLNNFFLIPKKSFLEDLGIGQGHPGLPPNPPLAMEYSNHKMTFEI